MTKQLLVRRNNKHQTLWEVYYEGGGELPAELNDTLFTGEQLAQKAIELHLAKRSNTNAKATPKSRSK